MGLQRKKYELSEIFDEWTKRASAILGKAMESEPQKFDGLITVRVHNISDDPNWTYEIIRYSPEEGFSVIEKKPWDESSIRVQTTYFGERFTGKILAERILSPCGSGMRLYSDLFGFNNSVRNRILKNIAKSTGIDIKRVLKEQIKF